MQSKFDFFFYKNTKMNNWLWPKSLNWSWTEFVFETQLVCGSDTMNSTVTGSDPSVKKQSIKMTEKALLEKIGNLQQER